MGEAVPESEGDWVPPVTAYFAASLNHHSLEGTIILYNVGTGKTFYSLHLGGGQ